MTEQNSESSKQHTRRVLRMDPKAWEEGFKAEGDAKRQGFSYSRGSRGQR